MRSAVILAALSVCFSSSARAEDSAPQLKVPPVADRPIEGQPDPKTGKKDPDPAAAPAASPDPSPDASATPESGESSQPSAENADGTIVSEPFPVSRYAVLWENSPFQLESIAPPTQSEGLAQRFVLGGILRENGEPVVWVRERATQQSQKVSKNATNNLGLSLVEIDESMEKQSEASATVRLGGEIGVIKFDAASAAGVPGMGMAPAPPMARPAVPMPFRAPQTGAPAPIPGQMPPGQAQGVAGAHPTFPVAQPGVVPPVPGPPVPADGQVQAPGQGQMPPPRVIRRRAIVPSAPSTP
jgi:hypothetical protein